MYQRSNNRITIIKGMVIFLHIKGVNHKLRTPNEGINQRYLKNWADVHMWQTEPERIYNSHYGNGVPAMFIS